MTANQTSLSFVSNRLLARFLIILLGLCIVDALIFIWVSYSGLALLSKEVLTIAEAEAADSRLQNTAIAQAAAYLVTGFVFLIWLYSAHENLPKLGVKKPEYSPGWAVGWFFVPIANLILPHDVVKALWKESNSEEGLSDAFFAEHPQMPGRHAFTLSLITPWWVCLLASNIIDRGSKIVASLPDAENTFVEMIWFGIISALLSIVAGVLSILIIKGIDERQEEKNRRLIIDEGLQDNLAAGTGA